MAKCWNSILRRVSPLFGAGLLLQAGSCSLDPATVTEGLLNTIVSRLIASVVFGVFNVGGGGF